MKTVRSYNIPSTSEMEVLRKSSHYQNNNLTLWIRISTKRRNNMTQVTIAIHRAGTSEAVASGL